MVKANTVRKKALEYVRKREWAKAINEYNRLVELDKHNPNLFNELGDLYLKTGNKHDALKSFEAAVEAYSRVSLYNNAIAVCKKILRLSPNQTDILFRLGQLRKSQGLAKEAISYFTSYLEKLILDVHLEPGILKEKVMAVVEEVPESTPILVKASDYLLKWEFREDGAKMLMRLCAHCKKTGEAEILKDAQVKLKVLGYDDASLAESAAAEAGEEADAAEAGATAGHKGGDSTHSAPGTFGYHDIELDKRVRDPGESAAAQSPSSAGSDGSKGSGGTIELKSGMDTPAPSSGPGEAGDDDSKGGGVHVSKIVDEFKCEIKDAIDEGDHRSHYDLGMAYLEMDLLPEAIHEFQLASKSNSYKVRSLEMIGLCFLKQDQPQLAIKQLEKGLEIVGNKNSEALGLLYTLGLAYEKIGEEDKARSYFEDVYVVDVAFRDIAEKIKKYTSAGS